MYGRDADTDRGFNRHNTYNVRSGGMTGPDGLPSLHNIDSDWQAHHLRHHHETEEEMLMDASVDLKRLRDNGKTPSRLKEGIEYLNYIVERTKGGDKDHKVGCH